MHTGNWRELPAAASPSADGEPGVGSPLYAPAFERPDLEPAPPQSPSRVKRTLGPVVAAIVAFLAKLKAILLFLPKLKLLVTAGSMFVSIAAYALLWGWQFAVGFVVLLFVHEMGHVIALRREGLKASAPMFIPFLGAMISARSLGEDALAEARVGLAGPILGTLGAAACIPLWHATGNDLFRALAYIGFLLNLFNLLPVVPLDGGRAMAAMAPWMWFVGFAALIPLLFVFFNPIFLIIMLFAARETWTRWQRRRHGGEREQAYYKVRPLDRALVAAVYVSLIAVLVAGMDATYFARTIS